MRLVMPQTVDTEPAVTYVPFHRVGGVTGVHVLGVPPELPRPERGAVVVRPLTLVVRHVDAGDVTPAVPGERDDEPGQEPAPVDFRPVRREERRLRHPPALTHHSRCDTRHFPATSSEY